MRLQEILYPLTPKDYSSLNEIVGGLLRVCFCICITATQAGSHDLLRLEHSVRRDGRLVIQEGGGVGALAATMVAQRPRRQLSIPRPWAVEVRKGARHDGSWAASKSVGLFNDGLDAVTRWRRIRGFIIWVMWRSDNCPHMLASDLMPWLSG